MATLQQFLGADVASSRPTPGVTAGYPFLGSGVVGLYYATDTGILSGWTDDGASGAWAQISFDDFTGDSGAGGTKGLVPAPSAGDGAAGKTLGAAGGWVAEPFELLIACGAEDTGVSTGTAIITFRAPFAFTLTGVRASLNTASSSAGPVTVDINESGTTVLSTKLTIDDTETTSTTAAAAAVISDADIADDAELTIDVDTAGSGAVGLKVLLLGTRV